MRGIYGEWRRKGVWGWKESGREDGLRVVEGWWDVGGKKRREIGVVIDGMDIVGEGEVECLWVVGSEGD